MRQIGTLSTESEAGRLAAYLVTQGIAAHAEHEPEGWAIWVRDENQVDAAKEELAHFREHPHDDRYEGVEREAESLRRQKIKRHEQIRKNVVEMRGKWGHGAGQKKPLTVLILIACVVIAMASNFGSDGKNVLARKLLFCDTIQPTSWNSDSIEDRLVDIKQGEVWRLVTPNLFHYGTMHLIFNMLMFYQLGGRVENNRGTLKFAMMISAFGLVSVAAQSLVPSDWGGGPFGAGMSGVIYGLFGYMWMKTLYDPSPDLYLSQFIIILLMAWFFLGVFGALDGMLPGGGRIANWAHGGGLVTGIAIGYAPELIKAIKRR